ncbi:MAG: hypothetical protein PHY40_02295, partial [Patescibacteria group bacterium]|nr:hypothetical protein [Patescibacteria group bacterium]
QSGNNGSNWQTNQGERQIGTGERATIYGSPKQPNFGFIVLKNTQIDTERTLTKQNSPYILLSYTVPVGKTLNIEAGTVVKSLLNASDLDVSGVLNVIGVENEPVVFTSGRDHGFADNSFDNEKIGTWSSDDPVAVDWQGIYFHPGAKANFNYAQIRYAGRHFKPFGAGWFASPVRQAIRAEGSEIAINNSKFAFNSPRGQAASSVFGKDSTINISNTTFEQGDLAIETSNSTTTLSNLSFNDFNNANGPLRIKGIFPEISGLSFSSTTFAGVLLDAPIIVGKDIVFKKENNYLINYLSADPSSIITIEPGTIINMMTSAVWEISGTLNANGSMEEKIIFRPYPENTKWGHILFEKSTSTLRFVDFAGGNFNQGIPVRDGGVIIAKDSSVIFENCSFLEANPEGNLIHSKNSNLTLINGIIGYVSKPNSSVYGIKAEGGILDIDNIFVENLTIGIYGINTLPIFNMKNMTENNFINVDKAWFPIEWPMSLGAGGVL